MCLKTASTQQEGSSRTLKVKSSLNLLAVLALVCIPGAAFAQSDTWTDASGDAKWSTDANWSNGVAPTKDTDVTVPAGPLAPYVDVSPEIRTLTIGGQVRLGNGITLQIDGSQIIDNGSLVLNNGGLAQTTLLLGGGSLTLSGTGVLAMSDQPNNVIDGPSGGTFINQLSSSQGIFGSGDIGNGHLDLQNLRTINANNQTNPITIRPNHMVTNMGVLEASGGGSLELTGTTYANAGGSIQANDGTVRLYDTFIQGGVLSTTGGGVIKPLSAVLNNLTNTGRYEIGDGYSTGLEGTITNTGTIALNAVSAGAYLFINGALTLAGNGSIVMSNNAGNHIGGSGTLTNQQTIQGAGTLNVATFQNQGGTVTANQSIPMTIQSAATGGNYNAIEGGSFGFDGGALNNATATASGGSFSLINNTTWTNTVTTGSGQFMTHSAMFSNCTNSGGIYLQDGDSLTWAGTFTDNGSVNVSPINQDALLVIDGPVTLSGSGTVKLQVNGAGATPRIKGGTGNNDSLTNYGTIEGGGFIGNNSMNLINGIAGKIIANSGWPMNIETGLGHSTQNLGFFEIIPPSTVYIKGNLKNYNASTQVFSSGSYVVGGTLQVDNFNIRTNKAKITLSGQFLDQNNNNGFRNLAFQKGTLILAAPGTYGSNFSIQGPVLTNTGKLTVQNGRTLSLLDSASSYNQVGGTTVVDGTIDVSSTGLVNVTGGSLAVNGTLKGSLSVGNPTSATGTFIIGDTTKKAGLVNISGNYTQVATGTTDVQIGGANAGTQYSQVNATGPVSLNGTLNIATVKYSPAVGQTFTIISSPSGITGTFSTVNGTTINATKKYVVSYTPQTVVLTVQ
jgi:hypothetical protein